MQDKNIAPQHDPDLFDHNDFILLRDQAMELFDHNAPHADIDAKLDELLRHLRAQFDREEQAMQAVGFPPAAAHKADHDRAFADLAARVERWKGARDRKAMLEFIEAGLADWFMKHVNTRDYITARFLSEGHS